MCVCVLSVRLFVICVLTCDLLYRLVESGGVALLFDCLRVSVCVCIDLIGFIRVNPRG